MQAQGPIAGPATLILSAFRRAWQDRRPYQTFSWIAGAALMLSGIVHFGVFVIDGDPWQGPLSWRKPVTFGLSFGLTTVTLAWLAGMLRYRRTLAVATATVAVTSAIEVFLVTMQKWRGVPSPLQRGDGLRRSRVFGHGDYGRHSGLCHRGDHLLCI